MGMFKSTDDPRYGCNITNVETDKSDMEKLSFDLIDKEGNSYSISITNFDAKEKLKKLKDTQKTDIMAFFHFGMTDIDVHKRNGGYVIMNSVCESVHDYFFVSQEEFDKLLIIK